MKISGKVLLATSNWKQQMYQFLRNYRPTPHCTTGITPATDLFGRPIRIKPPCPVAVPWETSLIPALMFRRNAHQKLKMKNRAESSLKPTKDSDIQVGDTKELELGEFCTPYHPVSLTVTSENHSMLTAEGGDRKVTRSYYYWKKLLLDSQFPLSVML